MTQARKILKLSAAVFMAVTMLAGCGTNSASLSDELIEANTSSLVINVTTDYEHMLPRAGEAAQFDLSESGSILIEGSEDEGSLSGSGEETPEEILPVDVDRTEEIRNALTEDEKAQRTYSLIYFDRPTVTADDIRKYTSVNTDEVAARMAEFADLYTPQRMESTELCSWESLSDLDRTAIAHFVNCGWIGQDEIAEQGIPYDDIIEYLEMDKYDSRTLSENAEKNNGTLEADTMRKSAPTDVSIAQSVFNKDKVDKEEVFLYTGNEINAGSNEAFVSSFMDYINDHTKDELYSMARNNWGSMNTESKRAFVYMLKLGWLEKGRLVQGSVSLAEVDRMYNLSFGK